MEEDIFQINELLRTKDFKRILKLTKSSELQNSLLLMELFISKDELIIFPIVLMFPL